MIYYFIVTVDYKKYHEEFFETDDSIAIKYMGYKEQAIREIVNSNKSENERLIVFSNYYSSGSIKKVDSEIVDTLELDLQDISRLRGLLIDSFHKLKT